MGGSSGGLEDILVWPCGSWCYRYELDEMSFLGDDYKTIPEGTQAHEDFVEELQ